MAELRRQAASSGDTLPGTESLIAMVSRWVNNHQQPSEFYRDLLARTRGGLGEFSALASGVDSAINLAERVRDVGVQVVVAAQSVEGLGDHRQAPRLLASCAGGVVVHQCPDPERLLTLAGQVRVLEHNWELDSYGPRGLAKARMGERPRIDPEQVRQAQPGEAGSSRPASPYICTRCHRPRWRRSRSSRPPPCR